METLRFPPVEPDERPTPDEVPSSGEVPPWEDQLSALE
jgi:hypothetical protein